MGRRDEKGDDAGERGSGGEGGEEGILPGGGRRRRFGQGEAVGLVLKVGWNSWSGGSVFLKRSSETKSLVGSLEILV